MDIYKCPKTENPKYFAQIIRFVTIIEFYGLSTKKIIFNLLPYFFYFCKKGFRKLLYIVYIATKCQQKVAKKLR